MSSIQSSSLIIQVLSGRAINIKSGKRLRICDSVLIISPIPRNDEVVCRDGVTENLKDARKPRSSIKVVSEEVELGVLVRLGGCSCGASFACVRSVGAFNFTGGDIFTSLDHRSLGSGHDGGSNVLLFIGASRHRFGGGDPQVARVGVDLGRHDGVDDRRNPEIHERPAHADASAKSGDGASNEDGDSEEDDEAGEDASDGDGDAAVETKEAGDELLCEDVHDEELEEQVIVVLAIEEAAGEDFVVGVLVEEEVVAVDSDDEADGVPAQGEKRDNHGEEIVSGGDALHDDVEEEREGEGDEGLCPWNEIDLWTKRNSGTVEKLLRCRHFFFLILVTFLNNKSFFKTTLVLFIYFEVKHFLLF